MVMALNMLGLLILSLLPGGGQGRHAGHGLQQIVEDTSVRQLLLNGRFQEYNTAVESTLSQHLYLDLKAKAGGHAPGFSPATLESLFHNEARSDLTALLGTIKSALAVATFVTELQTLGPAKAMGMAVQWVESGLIRKSGLKSDSISSFFQIASRPGRARIDKGDLLALDRDLGSSFSLMDSSYMQLASKLGEILF